MKKILVLSAAVLLLAAGCSSSKPSETSIQNSQNSDNQQQPQNNQTAQQPSGDAWQGTLKVSDNPAKGNLMLVMDKTTLYLRTSRDYSSLVGKKVNVTYKGSLDGFSLTDITVQ